MVQICETLFVVTWFSEFRTETVAEGETVPSKSDELRLTEVQKAYEQAENEFNLSCRTILRYNRDHKDPRIAIVNNRLFARVNALHLEPERARLESARDTALRKRNSLLEERAALLQKIGAIR